MNTIKKNNSSLIFKPVFLLLVLVSGSSFLAELSVSATTTVYIYPSSSTAEVGQTFFIDVKISGVVDLYGWEFKLGWNPNLLNVTDVIEGSFLKQGGSTFFSKKINNTVGYILVDCTLLGSVLGVNGNGTLATFRFYAKREGISALHLYDTKLVNSQEQPISHTKTDGSVTVSKSVGGIITSVNRLELLAPWIGLASVTLAMCLSVVLVRRWRRKG